MEELPRPVREDDERGGGPQHRQAQGEQFGGEAREVPQQNGTRQQQQSQGGLRSRTSCATESPGEEDREWAKQQAVPRLGVCQPIAPECEEGLPEQNQKR